MSDTTQVSESIDLPGTMPGKVFAFLTDPANHVHTDGSRHVLGPIGEDRITGKGDRFGMRMRWIMPYRIINTVVEFEQDRRLAWRHFGGHRWRYELAPLTDAGGDLGVVGTRVTETFDLSPVPDVVHPIYRAVFGYPDAYRANLRNSLIRLRDHLST